MFELVFKGFNSKEEAEAFLSWYEGQGEQDIGIWLEEDKRRGKITVDSMNVDIERTFPEVWVDNQLQAYICPTSYNEPDLTDEIDDYE